MSRKTFKNNPNIIHCMHAPKCFNETVCNSKHEVCIILQDHCKQNQQITLIRIFGSRHDIQRQK